MVKKFLAACLACVMILGMSTVAFAADSNTSSDPQIIGEFDGLLSDYVTTDEPTTRAIAQVRIRSTATYDSSKGVQVNVELYVPWYDFPKPKFTGMAGDVSVNLNGNTSKAFAAYANEKSTISADVNTGAKGGSGASGHVYVSGVATASNALAGGGAFAINYAIKLP